MISTDIRVSWNPLQLTRIIDFKRIECIARLKILS